MIPGLLHSATVIGEAERLKRSCIALIEHKQILKATGIHSCEYCWSPAEAMPASYYYKGSISIGGHNYNSTMADATLFSKGLQCPVMIPGCRSAKSAQ